MKIVHVVGARPNFMKAAPLVRALAASPGTFAQVLVHTGQHHGRRMSEVFFDDLDLPRPDVDLGVAGGSHAVQTAQVLLRLEPVLRDQAPDWVVVVGDVNSTLAAALVAAKLGIKVAHVEAGLRSFDRTMPEEINRVLTDQLAELLFTPSEEAGDNLRREGIDPARVRFVGNVMIDSLVELLPRAEEVWKREGTAGGPRGEASGDFVLATLHRPANVDRPRPLAAILAALAELSRELPVVFPVHPRTQARLGEVGLLPPDAPGLRLLQPLGYLEFLAHQAHARLVVTDSGGVQEETTYLGVPCLTVRPSTERPVTLTLGTNRLVAAEREAILGAAREALRAPRGRSLPPPPLWDGRAAGRIAEAFRELV